MLYFAYGEKGGPAMRQILLAALAVGAGLFCCCACSAPSTVSITLDDIEQEQLLLSDLQPNTPTPGPDDGVAPLTIIRAVESCGDGYIVYPKVLYCAHGEEINRSICELPAQRAASVSTAIFPGCVMVLRLLSRPRAGCFCMGLCSFFYRL